MIKFIKNIFKQNEPTIEKRGRFVSGPKDFEITDDPDYDIDSSLTLSDKEKKEIKEVGENKTKSLKSLDNLFK